MPPRTPDVLLPDPSENSSSDPLDLVSPEQLPPQEAKSPPMKIVWRNVAIFIALHIAAVYSLFVIPYAHPLTWAFSIFMYVIGALGITAGAHRLWSHKSYKAKLPLRIFLAICNSTAVQNDIFEWSRDHRVHHKYSESTADPHNATRGFFFAHVGWLLVRKHPDVIAKGKNLDLTDLLADPVVSFQRRYYKTSAILCGFVIPTIVPYLCWGESLWNAYFLAAILRYVLSLNATWCVNSAAHMWGSKPYDKFINPAENLYVAFGAIGEGFHNYHHTFPQDYSTSEFGWKMNVTTMFIDSMAYLGQVTYRKKMPYELVFRRKQRTGDGSSAN